MAEEHKAAQVQHLSNSFRTDAAHLIIKIHCANNHKEALHCRTSYIAKLVVDAYMSCECALKSMIASSSRNKSGVEVYAIILDCSHDLPRLIEQAQPKSLNDEDREFLTRASKYGVNLRYSFDLFSIVTCDWLPEDNVDLVMGQEHLKNFLKIAKSLATEADERHKKIYDSQKTFLLMNEVKNFVDELRVVSKKQRNMC